MNAMKDNRVWRRLRVYMPLCSALCIVIGIAIGALLAYTGSSSEREETPSYSKLFGTNGDEKLQDVLTLIKMQYADPISTDSLSEQAIVSLLATLDPHSVYINAEDAQRVGDEMSGSFSGIGVQFDLLEDTVRVVAVIHGGPSEKAGLMPGDKIVEVEDTSFTGKKMSEKIVMKTLRGQKGTIVKLGIMRNGDKEVYHYRIIRGDVVTKSIGASYMLNNQTGYIKVYEFTATTYQEFLTALNTLKKQGAKQFVIDLRDNPGGYLDAVTQMANEFLEKGDMIVYAEGTHYTKQEHKADGQGICKDAKVAVLVNEFSASASEIFAAAMQDNDRGTVIGKRTFGKGLVQQQYPLADGSALRLTVAHFYSPSGRCIQKPYTKGKFEDYEREAFDRFLANTDSVNKSEKGEIYKTKKGRTVYGGGGVTPDITIKRDTSYVSHWFSQVNGKGLMVEYAYLYADKNRNRNIQSIREDELLNGLIAYAEKKGVKRDDDGIKRSSATVKRILKAYVTRSLSQDENDFYRVFNRGDEAIESALKAMR